MQAVEDVKELTNQNTELKSDNILELIKSFANTRFSLESYDEDKFPTSGFTQKDLEIHANDLYIAVEELKSELIIK